MNDYNVSDYGIFTDAVNTSKTMNENILAAKNTIDDCKTFLSNEYGVDKKCLEIN